MSQSPNHLQMSQPPNHNTNNNYHHNTAKLPYSNEGTSPYQGYNPNYNSYLQSPYRNSPPQQPWQSYYPIGGYGHYLSNLGIHFPDVGFIGGPSVLGNPAEPGEMPSFDPEEIMSNIFKQYWQRVDRMYNPPGPPTTTTMEPGEYEGEITTKPPTTTTTTTRATTTVGKTTPTLSPTTAPKTTTTQQSSPQTTTQLTTATPTSIGTPPVTVDLLSMLLFNTEANTTLSQIARSTPTSTPIEYVTSGIPELNLTTYSGGLTTTQAPMSGAAVSQPPLTTAGAPTEQKPDISSASPVRK
ncbi:hypothetical protein EGW08_003488 [Elysia chlorotica]|uniref:Uncharacterized protein n=1 Tax=Elysia chlorotica TaxID=188477 RepID=A0A433U4Q0_ELYCH|nr:hypothetical protein EGW08_003488 [Elysia chlorotica]